MAISKAIEIAVKMEKDAIDFYREALSRTEHPTAIKMFDHFVKVELKHLRMLKDLVQKIDPKAKLTFPDGDIETVFSKGKQEMINRMDVTTDELEAIRLAADMEREGYDFYKDHTEKSESDDERELFKILAAQEEAHFNLLEKGYRHMKDTGKWFTWEDIGLSENF